MAAFAVFHEQANRKLAWGITLHFAGIVFLIPALSLAVRQTGIQEARQGMLWASGFVTLGWLLEQWQAGHWPWQTQICVFWETRLGNLILSLLLALALALISLFAIYAVLWLNTL